MTHAALLQTELKEKSKAKKIGHSRTSQIQETFKCTSYNLSETSIQVLLKFQLIEKRNSCAHLSKCFAVWCRAKEGIKEGFFYVELNSSRTISATADPRGNNNLSERGLHYSSHKCPKQGLITANHDATSIDRQSLPLPDEGQLYSGQTVAPTPMLHNCETNC